MLETNTASCGGFPGISDAFTSTLWAVDNALSMASSNFTNMLIHVGGQSDSYNPFTPPPSNISATHGWTTGAIYYALLAVAETFGSSNASQIMDLGLPSDYRPGYAIYENGTPTRIALLNFASDDTGASDYNALISLAGATVPSQVYVKYLAAPSVTDKFNVTWNGQTMGRGILTSDGRLQGTPTTQTIECDTGSNTCSIPMRAPSFALVFLSDAALTASLPEGTASTLTFATTALTKKPHSGGKPVIDPAVLATMNGGGGPGPRYTGSTGKSLTVVVSAAVLKASAVWSAVALVTGFALIMLR